MVCPKKQKKPYVLNLKMNSSVNAFFFAWIPPVIHIIHIYVVVSITGPKKKIHFIHYIFFKTKPQQIHIGQAQMINIVISSTACDWDCDNNPFQFERRSVMCVFVCVCVCLQIADTNDSDRNFLSVMRWALCSDPFNISEFVGGYEISVSVRLCSVTS